jgi:glyoxylase-like metal-dependent hydrolase (beta-lactamase superfamily II)
MSVRVAAMAMATLVPAMVLAQAPTIVTQLNTFQAGYYRLKIGDVDVIALSDGTKSAPTSTLVNITKPEVDLLMKKSFQEVPFQASINAYLLKMGNKLVMVDAGTGELYGPTLSKLPASLRAVGYEPSQITDIFVTHIHTDHTGGLMDGPTRLFPNAVIHASKKEVDHWFTPGNRENAIPFQKQYFDQAKAKFGAYLEAGQVKTFDGAVELLPGLSSLPAPGHTPGHTFYVLESKGQKLVFLGDVMHIAEVQLPHPEAAMVFDVDPEQAAVTRKAALSDAVKNGYLVAFAHMSFPGIGHVGQDGDGFRFYPIRYVNDYFKPGK